MIVTKSSAKFYPLINILPILFVLPQLWLILVANRWGADRKLPLRLCHVSIRSKLYNGCEIYAAAKHSQLKKLNTIQNQALRISSGAFCISPIVSLHADTTKCLLRNTETSGWSCSTLRYEQNKVNIHQNTETRETSRSLPNSGKSPRRMVSITSEKASYRQTQNHPTLKYWKPSN